MASLRRVWSLFIAASAASCAALAGLDDFADEPSANGGESASGGAGANGGVGPGGIGGAGGTGSAGDGGAGRRPVSWGVKLDGDAVVTGVATHAGTGTVWAVGLYRNLVGLPAAPAGAWASFIASFSPDGTPGVLEVLATNAGTPGFSPVYEPDADIFILGDDLIVATTSDGNGNVLQLGQVGIGKAYMAWGTFAGAMIGTPTFTQKCEVEDFIKGVSVSGSITGGQKRSVAVVGARGIATCTGDDVPQVTLQNETMLILDSHTPNVATPLSDIPGLRSAPTVALLGNTRVVTGHFDALSLGGTNLCGDGMSSGSCTLGSFGAFAAVWLSDGGTDAHYVGPIQPAPSGGWGSVRAAASSNEMFVALTERATRGTTQRDVRMFQYTFPNLVPRFDFDTPTDETVTAIAVGGGRTLLAGALGHAFDPANHLDGVVDDRTDHTGGCPDDSADIAGDAFWLLLDAQAEPIGGARYGDCDHQMVLDGDLDARGDVVVGGRFFGEMETPSGAIIETSSTIGSGFVLKIAVEQLRRP